MTTGRNEVLTGGCQCGAVRFRIEGGLGRASICHCRMCQKAFGGFFGPLVTARGLVWTKAEPARFRSSSKVSRGFCPACGTPLTYEFDGFDTEVAIGALDTPEAAPPALQVGTESALSFVAGLGDLPTRSAEELARVTPIFAGLVSYQHPDHPTPDERGAAS